MTKRQAIDLAERLWGQHAVIRYQHHSQEGRCRVGRFDGEDFLWLGAGRSWEKAFSQALSAQPLNETDSFLEILFK